MPEHVYLTPIPDNTSESIAFSSRNIPSQVVVSSSTHCTLLFCQSFQSKIPTQRKHTLSAPARSNEHLCWLPARRASAARPGRSPKVAARYSCGRKISDSRTWQTSCVPSVINNCLHVHHSAEQVTFWPAATPARYVDCRRPTPSAVNRQRRPLACIARNKTTRCGVAERHNLINYISSPIGWKKWWTLVH